MADIIHFTTVHSRSDTRIVVKEVATLAGRLEQTVALYVQDGLGNDTNEKYGFTVHDTGPVPKGAMDANGVRRLAHVPRCATRQAEDRAFP